MILFDLQCERNPKVEIPATGRDRKRPRPADRTHYNTKPFGFRKIIDAVLQSLSAPDHLAT
jgi:hypothetical protein